ncbi:hypothetical protein [Thalassoglobus sp.]|uniref:hypothetical protein n=1 Tax=Thalassoglobus sp. TaxID=2795869 RepID=UPI003AA901BB
MLTRIRNAKFNGKLLVLLLFIYGTVVSNTGVAAQAGDNFEGAVWSFMMVPKLKGAKNLRGQFRVSDHIVYQKGQKKTGEFTKRVGVNHPQGKRTKVVFTDLRALNSDREWREGMKGEVKMTIDKYGKWSGLFTDENGDNWEFTCNRVKE